MSGQTERKLSADLIEGISTVKNYILNANAWANANSWTLYNDGAATPTDGTGGTVNGGFTWSRSETTPIRGVADFNLVKPASNVIGHGVAIDFTVDTADVSKVMTIGFDYQVVTGTYNSGDLAVYIIADPTGTPTLITPAENSIVTVVNPLCGEQTGCTFSTISTTSSYRFVIHVRNTSTNGYTLAFDNFRISARQSSTSGATFVSARYNTSAAQSIATGAGSKVNFGVKEWDTHNAVTNPTTDWRFVAPISGEYEVSYNIRWGNGLSWTNGGYAASNVRKNGSTVYSTDFPIQVTQTMSTGPTTKSAGGSIMLLAGDYIDVSALHNEGTARALVAAGTLVWINIRRVGDYV